MKMLTIEVVAEEAIEALRRLEEKNLIKIIHSDTINSPAIPGKELSAEEFNNWIADAENSSTVSLEEAKLQWENEKANIKLKPSQLRGFLSKETAEAMREHIRQSW